MAPVTAQRRFRAPGGPCIETVDKGPRQSRENIEEKGVQNQYGPQQAAHGGHEFEIPAAGHVQQIAWQEEGKAQEQAQDTGDQAGGSALPKPQH
jgi:hypothetical protein